MQQPADQKNNPCQQCGGKKTVVVNGKKQPCSACLGKGTSGYITK